MTDTVIAYSFAGIMLAIAGQLLSLIGQTFSLVGGVHLGAVVLTAASDLIYYVSSLGVPTTKPSKDGKDGTKEETLELSLQTLWNKNADRLVRLLIMIITIVIGILVKALGIYVQSDKVVKFMTNLTS